MKKLESLEEDFKSEIEILITKTEEKTGRKWALSDGRRTMAEQRNIYAQGRTKPGKVVSNAKPGQSAHNFGYGADIWPLKANGDFDWNASDALFKIMADIAVEMNLTAGYYFKSIHDAPHIESKKWKEVQARWKAGEIKIA